MVSQATIRCVVGIVGNVISFFLFLSPLPTFIKIWKKGSVEQYSAVPYLVTYLNCMVWAVYGLPMVGPHDILLLIICAIGCFIQLMYLIIFITFTKDNNSKRLQVIAIILIEMTLVAVVASLTLTLVHSTGTRVRVIGIIGVITGIMMYASPLSIMKLVIKTKSVEFMPLGLSAASFTNAIVWTMYGALPFDPYVAAPSMMGVLLGLAQLILYAVYFKSTKQQQKEATILDDMRVATKPI